MINSLHSGKQKIVDEPKENIDEIRSNSTKSEISKKIQIDNTDSKVSELPTIKNVEVQPSKKIALTPKNDVVLAQMKQIAQDVDDILGTPLSLMRESIHMKSSEKFDTLVQSSCRRLDRQDDEQTRRRTKNDDAALSNDQNFSLKDEHFMDFDLAEKDSYLYCVPKKPNQSARYASGNFASSTNTKF